MRWRVFFFTSLAVNLALAAAWLTSHHRLILTREASVEFGRSATTVKTNVIIRRQFFSWSEVESPDYPTYIANLRAIGCPEQTIRDIIIADVDALFAKRIATDPDIVSPEQQWWRSEPDPEIAEKSGRRLAMIETERRALLTELLGISWETGDLVSLARPSHPGLALDGPVLGSLPADVKENLQEASTRADERLQAYLDAQRQAGKQPDPAEIARLRQEARADFARILTPPQLEEFLLRYSQNAGDLRAELGQLKYFNATPDEFRAIFHATDPLDQQLALLEGKDDPNSNLQRNQLLQQRESAIKLALGGDRFQEFQLLHDPLFRNAVATAEQAGVPEAAQSVYQINQAFAQQLAAIRANTNLTDAQRAIAIKQAELDQLKANALAMGEDMAPDETAPATESAPQPAFSQVTHGYVLGVAESAASVAMKYGISLSALQAANPGMDFGSLRPGDSIKIPGSMLAPNPPLPPPPAPGQ